MKANVSNLKGKKQRGFIMTTELVLLVTTMVVGMIVGLVTMRDAVNAEMEDVAEAIGSLDQSYAFDGIRNVQGTAEFAGSGFVDATDTNAGDGVTFTYVATDFLESEAAVGPTPSAGAASSSGTGTR
ncbi:hypothetical protein [Litorivivens sp.]|uniref:hypothetical protein n=1 Tax=Litorivivens sp. TaxID=2020868 RepID=UPI0035687394